MKLSILNRPALSLLKRPSPRLVAALVICSAPIITTVTWEIYYEVTDPSVSKGNLYGLILFSIAGIGSGLGAALTVLLSVGAKRDPGFGALTAKIVLVYLTVLLLVKVLVGTATPVFSFLIMIVIGPLFSPLSLTVFLPVTYPGALPLVPLVAILAFAWVRRTALRRSIRRKRGLCVKCAYDLRGLEHEVCPECGAEVVRSPK